MYNQLHAFPTLIALLLFAWTIPWKIYGVWLAAKNDDKKWFAALLLLNTVGLLEIFYIFRVAHKSWDEVKGAFRHVIGAKENHPDSHHDHH